MPTRTDTDAALVSGSAQFADLFEYEVDVKLHSLTPARGPSEGGSKMIVSGEHFSKRAARLGILKCRFNTTDIIAEYESGRSIVCVTPKFAPGVVTVEVCTACFLARLQIQMSLHAVSLPISDQDARQ